MFYTQSMAIFLLIIPIFLAFAYRARGGAIALENDTLARAVFWAVPIQIVCAIVAASWGLSTLVSLPCAVMAFAGACIGHASEQGNTIEQNEGMSYITWIMLGLLLMPFAVYLAYIHADFWRPFAAVWLLGPLGGLGYFLGYKMNRTLTLFGVIWCVPGDASWGEFYTGAFAFGLPLAILGMVGILCTHS